MKISKILGFIGIASVMTNQAVAGQKDLQPNDWIGTNDWIGDTTKQYGPYLGDEDFDETSSNSGHGLDETEIFLEDKLVVKEDGKKINRLDYFKTIDIPQWTAELETIRNQFEAKTVEIAKPTSYGFWKK